MFDAQRFRHLGGGRKGLFLLLRYVFIIAASYLVIFREDTVTFVPSHALMIAVALASNVALSFATQGLIFAWYVEAPVLIADTLWVSWALYSTGAGGQEIFLLYFFVLFLATLGESLYMVLLGSTAVSLANVYLNPADGPPWSSPQLLHVTFFYSVALFYGYVISQIKRERQRADKGFAWAKALETKVAERTAELRRLYEESRAASRLKSEFMANMSHELITPLHIILGYADLLLAGTVGATPKELNQVVGRIREAAADQLHLVDSILDLGRIESGKIPIHKRPVQLGRLVEALQQRRRIAPAPGVALHWQVDPNLPLIETDPVKLTVVLENLIDNAIKFTTAGSITVSVRDLPDDEQIEFRIDDTGPGIADSDLPTIFEAFRQLDGSLSRRHGGAGLGLTIASKYVGLLGGEIEVHSILGSGTTFRVALPHHTPGIPQANARNEAQRPDAVDPEAASRTYVHVDPLASASQR